VLVVVVGGILRLATAGRPAADAPATPASTPAAAPRGRLHVETTPPGVAIIANGNQVLGRSPIDVEWPAGHVELQAQYPDQPPRTAGVVIVDGETTHALLQASVPLVVTSTPPAAKVRVDGQLRGETPFDQGFLVEPGRVLTLRLEAPGFVPWEEQRTAVSGASLRVDARLVPLRADSARTTTPAAPTTKEEFGSIKVKCEPWANVRLGDVVLGEAPFGEKKVRAGRQTLTLMNPEVGFTDSFPVVVPANKLLTVIVRYEQKGSRWVPVLKSVR
jgi:hypothetical protein